MAKERKPHRPTANPQPKKSFTFRLDPDLVQALDRHLNGALGRTEYVEKVIALALDEAGARLPKHWKRRLEL